MEEYLISKLQAGESGVYALFSEYLCPFSDPNNNTTVSLVSRFTPFLPRTVQIIIRWFKMPSKFNGKEELALELFHIFRLCIDCLQLITSCLKWNPSVYRRKRVIFLVDIVGRAAKGYSKDFSYYFKVLRLVEEATPWFRGLDADVYDKCQKDLMNYLKCCTISLVSKLNFYDKDLVCRYFLSTMAEIAKSTIKDQIYEFAREICSSLLSLEGDRSSFSIDILTFVLDSLASEGKLELENNGLEFVQLVDYCANKCRSTNPKLCSALGAYLNTMADNISQVMAPFHLILRLYSAGLLFDNHTIRSWCDYLDFGSIGNLLHAGDIVQKDAISLGCSPGAFNEVSMSWTHNDGKAYLESYLYALKFICLPLADLVYTGKGQIDTECEVAAVSSIQKLFYHFCKVFLFFKRCKCPHKGKRHGSDENNAALRGAVALFSLSTRTKNNMKENVRFLQYIISSEWIEHQGLKDLSSSLYNIGVTLHKNKQLKEASKALKLCCKASWTCVERHCVGFVHQPNKSQGDLSEDIMKAFTNSGFLVDILHQCGSLKVKSVIIECLKKWSIAANLCSQLPVPEYLVVQWVKIESENQEAVDFEDSPSTSTLYYRILSSSEKVLKSTIGIILEQEICAYDSFIHSNPELSLKRQRKIVDYLQQEASVKLDNWQRSRILMRKARTLRSYGSKYLEDCIQCLSKAISFLEAMCHETCDYGIQPFHQLALAYCLRAFCTHEAEPNSKQVLKDIEMALNQWLSIIADDRFSDEDKCLVMTENVLIMLYNCIDLFSLKGCVDLHSDAYRVMVRLFQWTNIPLEKLLAVLWEYRRICHGLCVLPLSDTLTESLSDHFGVRSRSIDFWISCLKGSQPLLVGFQHNFSFMFASFLQASCNHESSFRPEITVDEVENVASNCSDFVASHLFYDLSQRLISNGQIIEALFYARKAFHRRSKLFKGNYCYVVEKFTQTREVNKQLFYELRDFQVRGSVACKFWPLDSISWDLQSSYLSPWIILQCYLESTFQIGVVHELLGNGEEAESCFIWGKKISCLQSLPIFMVAFSSALGKLYCKTQFWDLAQTELHSARQHLQASSTNISCKKCKLLLEVTIDQSLADLSQSIIESSIGRKSVGRSFDAESLYKSALDKLNLFYRENFVICHKEASTGSTVLEKGVFVHVDHGCSNASAQAEKNQWDTKKPYRKRLKGDRVGIECKETRDAPILLSKGTDSMHRYNLRSMRSKYQTSQNQRISGEIEVGREHLSERGENDCSGTSSQSDLLLEIKSCRLASNVGDVCVCNKMRCWYCLPMQVIKHGLVSDFLNMKWESAGRRLSLKLLSGLGSCLESKGRHHEAHEIVFQSMSILVRQDSFHLATSTIPFTLLLDIIGKEIIGDMFSIERAEILYNICWLSLNSYLFRDTRIVCCEISRLSVVKLVAWLMLAFVLCREVPVLFQKVSRLLAVMFLLSSSNKLCSFASSCKSLSVNHWASYFHQASVGAHFSYQYLTIHGGRYGVQHLADAKGCYPTDSTCVETEETRNLPRIAPDSVQDLEDFVETFIAGLPCTTAVCISLLVGPCAILLRELLHHSCIHLCLLISRLDSNNQPIVLLLPVNSILEGVATSGFSDLCQGKYLDEPWQCPWSSSLTDDVAPEFKLILEENYISSFLAKNNNFELVRDCSSKNEKEELLLDWKKKLNDRLAKFLRNLEDTWLGPWKYVLLGELSDLKRLELVHKKLVRDLKRKCKMEIEESTLKMILGGPKDTSEKWMNILLSCLKKGCCIGGIEFCNQERCRLSSNDVKGAGNLSGLALELIHQAVNELQGEDSVDREPMILVLDSEVQMLPWESIPVLRNMEVYRMPSFWSISASLNRSHRKKRQVGMIPAAFPFIDPLDAFYVVNPDGSLSKSLQTRVEGLLKDHNLEGKAGCIPAAEEWFQALKSHDLFIYFGHGSGTQFISRKDIRKLENCAATCLMGCSSGSLRLFGPYLPRGTPVSYLLAGSPVVVANLWEVSEFDLLQFATAMLVSLLKERSRASLNCAKCNLETEEASSLCSFKANVKKRKLLPEACPRVSTGGFCRHSPKIGSFIGQARQSCQLPFLFGSAPICYGVPTVIKKKL